MILCPAVSNDAKKIIQAQLNEIAKTHNIRILLAIESGSRAWGFPSLNSDYDVRFIYARSQRDYLSVQEYRDVIDPKIINNTLLGVPLDISGWDIRKVLQLALKSNSVLFEWLQSPICYVINQEIAHEIMQFAMSVADLKRIKYHYFKLAMSSWRQIEENAQEVILKHYFYALRPALSLRWATMLTQIPPMALSFLMDKTIEEPALVSAITRLVAFKATSREETRVAHNFVLDSFIKEVLSEQIVEQEPLSVDNETIKRADVLFQRIILQPLGYYDN